VGDLHVAVGGDGGDVAGAQPAVVELLRSGIAVVRARDPRATRFDLADRLAVPREDGVVVADDPQLDAGQRATGLLPPVHLRRGAGLGAPRWEGDGGHRAGLREAPRLQHADAEAVLES